MSKISAYTAKTSPDLTDEFVINDVAGGSVNKKITWENLTETGTFTPTIYGSTTAGTQTYTTQIGKYCRAGKMVQFDIYIVLSALDGATAGNIYVGGLPYTSGYLSSAAFSYVSGITLTSSYFINGFINNASTYIRLFESNGTIKNGITEADLTASTTFIVSGTYQAA